MFATGDCSQFLRSRQDSFCLWAPQLFMHVIEKFPALFCWMTLQGSRAVVTATQHFVTRSRLFSASAFVDCNHWEIHLHAEYCTECALFTVNVKPLDQP